MLTHRFTVRQTFRSSRASSSALPFPLAAFLLFSRLSSRRFLAPLTSRLRESSPAEEAAASGGKKKGETGGGSGERKRTKKREISARVRSLTLDYAEQNADRSMKGWRRRGRAALPRKKAWPRGEARGLRNRC